MGFRVSVQASSWGRPALLWGSWACAVWFALVWITVASAESIPHLYGLMLLSYAGLVIGLVMAVVYLLLGIWLPVRWRLGIGALLTNSICFVLVRALVPSD
jgi:hypothetical protein